MQNSRDSNGAKILYLGIAKAESSRKVFYCAPYIFPPTTPLIINLFLFVYSLAFIIMSKGDGNKKRKNSDLFKEGGDAAEDEFDATDARVHAAKRAKAKGKERVSFAENSTMV